MIILRRAFFPIGFARRQKLVHRPRNLVGGRHNRLLGAEARPHRTIRRRDGNPWPTLTKHGPIYSDDESSALQIGNSATGRGLVIGDCAVNQLERRQIREAAASGGTIAGYRTPL